MLADRIRAMGAPHWLALFGLILAAWTLLWLMAVPTDLRDAAGAYGPSFWQGLCTLTPDAAGLARMAAMWVLMSAAMMAPTILPALATYDDLAQGGAATRMGPLLAGYLAVWLGFSGTAAGAQMILFRAGLLDPLGQSTTAALSAAMLLVAGLYQFSPVKEACLSKCRRPLTFFMAHWDGRAVAQRTAPGAGLPRLLLGADGAGLRRRGDEPWLHGAGHPDHGSGETARYRATRDTTAGPGAAGRVRGGAGKSALTGGDDGMALDDRTVGTVPWTIKGELILNCNCTVFCPCVVSLGKHPPTEGHCQTWGGVRIDKGALWRSGSVGPECRPDDRNPRHDGARQLEGGAIHRRPGERRAL